MKKNLTRQQVLSYRRRVLADAEKLGVSAASRRHCIHRDTIYAWRKEFFPQKPGPAGTVWWQTDEVTSNLILQVRLSLSYGPKRIKDELADIGVAVGEKAIRGVIERAGLVRKQRKPRTKATQSFYAPRPGYRIQVDTNAMAEHTGQDKRRTKTYQFTAIDIVSKIRYLKVMTGLSNSNSVAFVKEVIDFFYDIGIAVECVQTDNHPTFTNLYVGGNKKTDHELRRVHPLTQYLLSVGIEHKLSRPGTPQHNGFVERSHRTDEEEFYQTNDLLGLDTPTLSRLMKGWQDEYNLIRRHTGCANMPPMQYFIVEWKDKAILTT